MTALKVGARFEHNRLIIGSPKAGTARPEVCTITRVTAHSVWYRNESGMLLRRSRDAYFDRVIRRWLP